MPWDHCKTIVLVPNSISNTFLLGRVGLIFRKFDFFKATTEPRTKNAFFIKKRVISHFMIEQDWGYLLSSALILLTHRCMDIFSISEFIFHLSQPDVPYDILENVAEGFLAAAALAVFCRKSERCGHNQVSDVEQLLRSSNFCPKCQAAKLLNCLEKINRSIRQWSERVTQILTIHPKISLTHTGGSLGLDKDYLSHYLRHPYHTYRTFYTRHKILYIDVIPIIIQQGAGTIWRDTCEA